jgi:hypothetical protein
VLLPENRADDRAVKKPWKRSNRDKNPW